MDTYFNLLPNDLFYALGNFVDLSQVCELDEARCQSANYYHLFHAKYTASTDWVSDNFRDETTGKIDYQAAISTAEHILHIHNE